MADLTRREILSTGAAVAAATMASAIEARPVAGSRPNILWLVSEDNNPFVGAYGDRRAHTPTLDRLAAEGILYRNVYSNAPVCAPSRFGIITGVHAESAGPAHNMRAEARLPRMLAGFPQFLRQAGYYCTNSAKTDYNSNLDTNEIWDVSGKDGHWRNRPDNAPFFAVFNHEITHESAIFNSPVYPPAPDRVKPGDIALPAYLPDTPGIRQDFATYYNRIEQMDGQIARKLADLDAAGLADDTIVFYYSDNGGVLPRSKRYCYDEGHRCAMILRIPEKWRHLAPSGPGTEIAAPVSFIDLAPTVLSIAGLKAPAHMQGKAFLGPHAARPKQYAFGMRNRMDERYDMVRTVTDGRYRYIRNYSPHRIWGQHVAFEWNAKGYQDWEAAHQAGSLNPFQDAFWQTKPFEQFFDLRADRDQVNNAIDDPAHRQRISAMREALDAHMLSINDNGFIPEGSPIEGYDESRRTGAYPLRRIIALAGVAAKGEPKNLLHLRERLGDANEVIRYWAAQGLLILGEHARAALPDLEKLMVQDPSPHVRIVAAEAHANLAGGGSQAVSVLASLLDTHTNPRVRLQAINSLTYVGDKARSAKAVIKRAAESDDGYLVNAGRYLGMVLDGTYTPSSPILTFSGVVSKTRVVETK